MSDTYNSLVSADYRTTSNGSVKLVQVTIIIISHLCGVINTVPRGVQIYHQDVTVSIRRSRFETNFIPLDKIQSLLSFHLVQRVACQDATAQVSFYRHLISLADVNLI